MITQQIIVPTALDVPNKLIVNISPTAKVKMMDIPNMSTAMSCSDGVCDWCRFAKAERDREWPNRLAVACKIVF